MNKAIAKGTVGTAVVMAILCLTTLALAEDFGSIAGGGVDYSGGGGAAQESAGPVSFQSAGQAMESADNGGEQAVNEGDTKLVIQQASGMPDVGQTVQYENFPIERTADNFIVSFAEMGVGQVQTQTFPIDSKAGADAAYNQAVNFIKAGSDPATTIRPITLNEMDMQQLGVRPEDWGLSKVGYYARPDQYVIGGNGMTTLKSIFYYEQNGKIKEFSSNRGAEVEDFINSQKFRIEYPTAQLDAKAQDAAENAALSNDVGSEANYIKDTLNVYKGMDSKLLSSDGKEILTWVGEQSDTIFDHYNALGDAEYSKGKRDEAAKSYNQTIQLDALYKSMPMTLTPETEGVTYAQGKIDAFNQMFPANTYAQKTSSAEGANGAVYYQSAGSTEQWVLVSDGKSNKFVDMSVGVLHEARDTTGNLANLLNDNPGNDVEVTILSTNQKVWMEQSAFDAGKTF